MLLKSVDTEMVVMSSLFYIEIYSVVLCDPSDEIQSRGRITNSQNSRECLLPPNIGHISYYSDITEMDIAEIEMPSFVYKNQN